jgi:hypothetical protein
MPSQSVPQGALLVGSVPLDTAEDVFRDVSEHLGHHLRRLPDGETGDRQHWVQFQLGVIGALPQFEMVAQEMPGFDRLPPTLRLRDGYAAADVDFGDLGYADIAIESWQTFQRLQAEGVIPDHVRFQVSLPTPMATGAAWLATNPEFPALFERYTAAMLEQVERICAAIPHDRLAIQWDVCFELCMFEGWRPIPAGMDRADLSRQLVEISNAVPADVELGYHLCFGDFNHQHAAQPDDTGPLVELVNSFVDDVARPVNWIHVPVPIERDDDAYFAPLQGLHVPEGADLYIGLLHFRDGAEGAQRRIATAQRFAPQRFGVATECGFGRRPADRGGTKETLDRLLQLHAESAQPVV